MKNEDGRMRKVLIAVKEPGKAWKVQEVYDQLLVYQEIVGGYIECCYKSKDGFLVFGNEEGKINGSRVNLMTAEDYICGTVFAVRSDEDGEFQSLTDADLIKLGLKGIEK